MLALDRRLLSVSGNVLLVLLGTLLEGPALELRTSFFLVEFSSLSLKTYLLLMAGTAGSP